MVDDEDRENEGDFICAAEKVTPEINQFHGQPMARGLDLGATPDLRTKVVERTGSGPDGRYQHGCLSNPHLPFSVDLIGHGCTTGISAVTVPKTIKGPLLTRKYGLQELGKPGHIFPLKPKEVGCWRRTRTLRRLSH